ncbi:4Fe-4S binding protein [Candidatus Micrarchaeota archaeon]|nr:4Fe-4S binding protein [Candidatus Micrarchaeota archaeon]MBU1939178.1 4Fe-4S binding protein [Candidatus Micrarchaeota archaeon]
MGSWATHVPVFDRKKCIKCHLCWIYCPDTAIKINKDGTTRTDYSICKGCSVCAGVCPTKCITMKRHEG